MALWARSDTLAGAPKNLTKSVTFITGDAIDGSAETITISGGHGFNQGEQVKLTNGATSNVATAGTYFVGVKTNESFALYDTLANATLNGSGGRANLTDQGGTAANPHTIQIMPNDIYFVDSTEAGIAANIAKGFKTPGWHQYRQRTSFSGATTVTLANVEIENTAGQIGFTASSTLKENDRVIITGTVSGNEGAITTPSHGAAATTTFIATSVNGAKDECVLKTEDSAGALSAVVTTTATGNAKIGSVNASTVVTAQIGTVRNDVEILVAMGDGTDAGSDAGVDGADDSVLADS